jgi:hypothetical protein
MSSAKMTNRLMLFRRKHSVYCDKYMKHTNTLYKQNGEFWYVKADGTYNNHRGLKGQTARHIKDSKFM